MTDIIRDRLTSVLFSSAAQKIDFYLDKIHVDGSGFSYVALALLSKAKDDRGIKIAIGHLPAGAEASYDPATNTFRFPTAGYGLRRAEQMTLIHESVHALRDASGVRLRTRTGLVTPTALSDEAAAIVAGALFDIFNNPADSVTPSFASGGGAYDCAYAVAMQMVGNPGADVGAVFGVGLDNLKAQLRKDRAYAHIDLGRPYGNNGLRL